MMDRVLTPIGIEQTLLALRLINQTPPVETNFPHDRQTPALEPDSSG